MKWKKPLAERFWEKVDKRGPDDCWPWIGATYNDGSSGERGQIWDGTKVVPAPQLSLEIHGRPLNGLWALHTCRTTLCVNPAHLYPGTRSDNVQDSIRDGTFRGNPAPKGEANYNAVLTENEVRTIRQKHADGRSIRSLARDFGVSVEAARKVVVRKTWCHV